MGRWDVEVGMVNIREVPGDLIEVSSFTSVKDSGLGYEEGAMEAMKSYTNAMTHSLPGPVRRSGDACPASWAA
jgi:aldehyde dehydrogenase (NAD+)